jgi:hypothetical protein
MFNNRCGSIETIERDFSRQSLLSSITNDTEPLHDVLPSNASKSIQSDKKDDPIRSSKKRHYGEDVPWNEEELLMLYKAEKWGKMNGNLSLAREIFLPRRNFSDIKNEKQSDEYKEFCQKQRDFESFSQQNKKRKIGEPTESETKQKVVPIEKKPVAAASKTERSKQSQPQKVSPLVVKKQAAVVVPPKTVKEKPPQKVVPSPVVKKPAFIRPAPKIRTIVDTPPRTAAVSEKSSPVAALKKTPVPQTVVSSPAVTKPVFIRPAPKTRTIVDTPPRTTAVRQKSSPQKNKEASPVSQKTPDVIRPPTERQRNLLLRKTKDKKAEPKNVLFPRKERELRGVGRPKGI